MCCLFLCGRSNMDLRTKQACEIYVTFTIRWNNLNPGQRPSDMCQGSSKPIQQCKLKTIGCYFCVHAGPHNTSLSNAVKRVAVLKYRPHDVVACNENQEDGHV